MKCQLPGLGHVQRRSSLLRPGTVCLDHWAARATATGGTLPLEAVSRLKAFLKKFRSWTEHWFTRYIGSLNAGIPLRTPRSLDNTDKPAGRGTRNTPTLSYSS